MRKLRPKTLFIPVLGLLLAVLVLLTVVMITTYINLEGGRKQARHILAAQASAIAGGLTAGLRTGWRHWVWQEDSLQNLLEEMSQSGDVAFIVLLNDKGQILAQSDPQMAEGRLPGFSTLQAHLNQPTPPGWLNDNETLYYYGRHLADDDYRPGGGGGGGSGHMGPGRMMRQRMMEMNPDLKPEYVLIGLNTTEYRTARQRQAQHSLTMAILLFVLGSAAIYFIFVVQNYRTIERTLTDLSTYTARIVDNMPNGLISLSAKGEPIMVNRASRDLFGWGDTPEKDLENDPVITALAKTFSSGIDEHGILLEEEFEAPTKQNDYLPLAVSAAGVPAMADGDDRPGMIFILRDLRQIRALEDRVRQNEKLAAVGRLAAGVAHEVRNPLSSMRGLARFLGRDLDEKSREAEYLKVMVEEIDRLDRVISGLLDFAKPRHPNLAPVDLNEVARYTSDLMTDDIRHVGVSLREDMSSANPVILADRDQVIQAMLNVLLNAVEAMPDGGRMTVSTQSLNGEAVFAVEDTGTGISPKDRSKLLDPFFTTKKKGTGLGLAQVAGIMEAHGGRVELGGEPGMGARVSLHFRTAPTEATETDQTT